jgi:hypothetical protein
MRPGITAPHLKRGSSLIGKLVVKLPRQTTKNYHTRLKPQSQRRRSDLPAKVNHPNKDPSYLTFLPQIIQDSVKRILNPDSDGHCGFRAIAWCLGRGQDDYMWIRQELIYKNRYFTKSITC